MHGKFIVLEGPDGSGTTRQSEYLAANIRQAGWPVLLTAEPTQGKIGRQIRQALNEYEDLPAAALQLLFCADRAEHVEGVIKPALRDGVNVVCDRYIWSTVIYGAAQGLDAAWLTDINDAFIKPDLTIVTLPPLDVCMERLGSRAHQDVFETTLFQKRVYEGYKNLPDERAIFVDTTGKKQENAAYIWQQAKQLENGKITDYKLQITDY